MGEISKLGCSCKPCEQIPCIFCICCCFQCVKPWLHSKISDDPPRMHVGPILIYLEDRFSNYAHVPRYSWLAVCQFCHCNFCQIHMECCRCSVLLGITYWSGSHECVPKGVLGFENRLDVVAVPNPLELIRDALHIGDDH